MKAMEGLRDLIEEAKLRTVYWALCIFSITYFLTHTSKSMWMNIPISILLVSALRVLFNEAEFHWKVRKVCQQTYLAHLEKKQLSVNDSRLPTTTPPLKWKRKIDSPVVEAALEEFIKKLLRDFVRDLWYSDITPDKEAPELMRAVVMDVFGEISGRLKDINLVDLLTRDVVDLVGDHLDLFRRNQAAIGVDVMGTLSSEERDERLKYHLIASKELHPALISPECEYKVLQWLIGGLLAVVLRPREAQCPLVRCIARELVTCLVMQPVMNFASPVYINELIEYIFLAIKDEESKVVGDNHSPNVTDHISDHAVAANVIQNEFTSRKNAASYNQETDLTVPWPADWAQILEAATQRRTEVLMPENLENMWAKGRNYGKQENIAAGGLQAPVAKGSAINRPVAHLADQLEDTAFLTGIGNNSGLKRSNSTYALKVQSFTSEGGGPIITEFYSPDSSRHNDLRTVKSASDNAFCTGGVQAPKLRCRVMGAYFEKLGSQSFAVYSIAVTDADKNTWFVKRRYRNFERLHRHLKDIRNYTLHLPPKRIFSSSTEDAFVHQRCIQLDKYLQDLLSIANVAEQHEVWDFLSVSSKYYSSGKSSSVMRFLAVNVDDAVVDVLQPFKGGSDALLGDVVASTSPLPEASPSISSENLSWNADEINKHLLWQNTTESAKSFSDNEEGEKDKIYGDGWHSDNELDLKRFQPRVVQQGEKFISSNSKKKPLSVNLDGYPVAGFPVTSEYLKDPTGVPPDWTPPNLSIPMLNLVDKMFQLKRQGWLRRQVFWMSKQILQLMMEDAIDDWLLRQIQWLRRDDVIAQGIQWVQDVLWPEGTFFTRLNTQTEMEDSQPNERSSESTSCCSKVSKAGSFEQQLEAARRASDVKKMIFNGAPTALVSLIGHKQYQHCAKDIYYFLQSTICLKQLAYGILELGLVSVFPELRDLVLDVHEKMHTQPV